MTPTAKGSAGKGRTVCVCSIQDKGRCHPVKLRSSLHPWELERSALADRMCKKLPAEAALE